MQINHVFGCLVTFGRFGEFLGGFVGFLRAFCSVGVFGCCVDLGHFGLLRYV